MVLQAAFMMDKVGNKAARKEIAMIKTIAPAMTLRVVDRAIQAHGGMGVCQDTPLASFWAGSRTLRIADGPDEVHWGTTAQIELKQSGKQKSRL